MSSGIGVYRGRAWKLPDNISTDHILPSRYMTEVEPHELAAHCLAGVEEGYSRRINTGDVIAAGDNTGYGSSREQAPQALKHAGVSAVVAKSFQRIFYRNCFNVGLPAIVCPAFVDELQDGDGMELDIGGGTITNTTAGKTYTFVKPPEFLLEYVAMGGLIPCLEKKLAAGADSGCGR
jgi:3-isopropylmalate/(R)-2-methylmalate dehydratase small subunit